MVVMLKDVLISLGMGLGLFTSGPIQGPVQNPSTSYQDLIIGTGQSVSFGQKVTIHLLVADATGREYANTKKRGLPYSFRCEESSSDPMNQWILGMKVGGQRRLNLTPDESAGYAQIVPSNTPLVVVVTVLRASDR